MEGTSQGPQINRPKPKLTLNYLAKLNRHGDVTRVLRSLIANGELADYDDELANRVHDAIEIVEGVVKLNEPQPEDDGGDCERERPGYSAKELRKALGFVRDLAEEELPHANVGTGAEVALRHIARRARESLHDND